MNGKSPSELADKVEKIKDKINYYEAKLEENSLSYEREKAKLEMLESQLKELGYSFDGLDSKIEELAKEIEDAIEKAGTICSEAGIHI